MFDVIATLLSHFVQAMCMILIPYFFLPRKLTKGQWIVSLVSAFAIFSAGMQSSLPSLIGSMIIPTIVMMVFMMVYLKERKYTLLLVFYSLVYVMIAQAIVVLILSSMGISTSELDYSIKAYLEMVYLIANLTVLLMALVLRSMLSKVYSQSVQVLERTSTLDQLIWLGFIVINVALLGMSVYIRWKYSLSNHEIIFDALMVPSYLSFVLVTNYLVFKNLKKKNETSLLSTQHIMQDSYKDIIGDIKGFWHSYANVMQAIDVMVNQDQLDVNQLKSTLADYATWHGDQNIKNKLAIADVPHVVLGSVLSTKLSLANDLKVPMHINVKGEGVIACNMRDLIEILGVALDNAIQAAHAAEGSVCVVGDFGDKGFNLKVNNDYVSIDGQIIKHGKSHGIGLEQVKKIAKRTKNLSISHGIVDDNYVFDLKVSI